MHLTGALSHKDAGLQKVFRSHKSQKLDNRKKEQGLGGKWKWSVFFKRYGVLKMLRWLVMSKLFYRQVLVHPGHIYAQKNTNLRIWAQVGWAIMVLNWAVCDLPIAKVRCKNSKGNLSSDTQMHIQKYRNSCPYRLVLAHFILLKWRLASRLCVGPINAFPSYPRFWGVDVGHPDRYQRHEPGGGPFCTLCGLYMLPVRQIYHHFRVWTVFRTRLKLRRCFAEVKCCYDISLGV